jgi:hypothetical protein
MSPNGLRNQELLCQREPEGIYWTGLEFKGLITSRIGIKYFSPLKVKGKTVKFSLCLINQGQHYEDVSGNGGVASQFLSSALDGGEWPASCPSRLTPTGKSPQYTYDRLGGPQSWPGHHEEEKNPYHCLESNPSRPVCSPSLFQLSYPNLSLSP